MATSRYDILELRVVIEDELTHLYVRISDANDFMPIGGWYHKVIPASQPSLPALSDALVESEYLMWDRGAPGEKTSGSMEHAP